MPTFKLSKELVKKYLDNSCSPEELEQLKQLLKHPESTDFFNEVLDESWDEMESPEPGTEALEKYRERFIQERNTHKISNKPTIKFWQGPWLKYAAVFLLVSTLGLYYVSRFTKAPVNAMAFIEKYNPNGQRCTIILPDSTLVYLGSNSKIRFPKTFSNTRELELVGEAFFEVKKDPKRPFIIHTGTIHTKVLGTSFKIEAFKGNPIQVSVATGKVRVDRQSASTANRLSSIAVLTPGQLLNWNESTQKSTLGEVTVDDLKQWKDGNLIFNNQRLADVVAVLERCYNINIEISSDTLSNYRINTTCSLTEPLSKIMDIISKTGGFKYKKESNRITISN